MPAEGCLPRPDLNGTSLVLGATTLAVASPSSKSGIDSMLERFFKIKVMRHHQVTDLLGYLLHRFAADIDNWPSMGFAEA